MSKHDYPALLKPGLHRVTLEELHALAVAPFPEDERRKTLHGQLAAWAAALQSLGVGSVLWLDGSFLTEKPAPGDIDCVLWHPHWVNGPATATLEVKEHVKHLLDRDAAEKLFGLDLYIEVPTEGLVFHRESYWRGVLGFCHDRTTAKGFAEIQL